MQTFDQALFHHVKAGLVTVEDAIRAASHPHDFKLLLASDGRKGTTMDDVAAAYSEQKNSREAADGQPAAPREPEPAAVKAI
jgi:twitching motility protein PilT